MGDFEHVDQQLVLMIDKEGTLHVFHFGTRLFGSGTVKDAFKLREDGVPAKLKVIGDPEVDLLSYSDFLSGISGPN